MTTAQLIRAALFGGRRMTVAEIAGATGRVRTDVVKVLKGHEGFIIVGERPTVSGRRGGNKAAAVWALAGTAPEVKRAAVVQLGPDGPTCGEIRDAEGVGGAHDYGGRGSSIIFVASPEETDCPTLGRVVLAACIDGYVTDSARQRGPCDSCAIGRARRAAWAGADFEDELETDGDEASP